MRTSEERYAIRPTAEVDMSEERGKQGNERVETSAKWGRTEDRVSFRSLVANVQSSFSAQIEEK